MPIVDRNSVFARVDFAGGWLDVPRLARHDGFVVNCSVTPRHHFPEDRHWREYRGMGGSGALAIYKHLVEGKTWPSATRLAIASEMKAGGGWQDPAIVAEGGCCVWRSGPRPFLEHKNGGEWLEDRMFVVNSGQLRPAIFIPGKSQDYDAIVAASQLAAAAVVDRDVSGLANAIRATCQVQLAEGMDDVSQQPRMELVCQRYSYVWKYLGAGWGGAILMFFPREKPVGPWAWMKKVYPRSHYSFKDDD